MFNPESYSTQASFTATTAKAGQLNSYSLQLNMEHATRLQELFVEQDENGNISSAQYASGAQVRHNSNYTMVRSANNTLWMGDRNGGWHPLD